MTSTRNRPVALILSTATGYGGGERSLEALLPQLARDYTLHILIENKRHIARCREILGGTDAQITTLQGMARPLQLLRGVAWLLWRLRRHPAFVLANTNKGGMIVAIAAKLRPALAHRSVLYVRDFQWLHLGFIIGILRKSLYLFPSRALLDAPDYIAPHLEPQGPLRWAIVPNIVMAGTDNALLPPTLKGLRYVLSLGSITRWKGQHYLLEAIRDLPSDIHAVICGEVADPGYRAELEQLANTPALKGRVHFLPHQPSPGAILRGAVCVAVTSVAAHGGPETFSRIVIEAWAEGVPVVAFDVGGPHYLIENGQNGLLVPEGDSSGLTAAINSLLSDERLGARLTKGGADRIQMEYHPATIYPALHDRIAVHCTPKVTRIR